jgi:hypothetical protein
MKRGRINVTSSLQPSTPHRSSVSPQRQDFMSQIQSLKHELRSAQGQLQEQSLLEPDSARSPLPPHESGARSPIHNDSLLSREVRKSSRKRIFDAESRSV